MALANGLTPKQDAFAMAYVESGNAAEAYRRAYKAENMKEETVWREAHALATHPKVTTRVEQLRERAQKRHDVTLDSLTEELEEARKLAVSIEQPSAMVSASMGKAKLHGLITDKAELSGKDGAPSITMTITRSVKTEIRG